MATYESKELKQEVEEAIEIWKRVLNDKYDEFFVFNEDSEYPPSEVSDDEISKVTYDSILWVALPEREEDDEIKYRDFINWAREVELAKFVGESELWTNKRILVSIEAVDYESEEYLNEAIPEPTNEIERANLLRYIELQKIGNDLISNPLIFMKNEEIEANPEVTDEYQALLHKWRVVSDEKTELRKKVYGAGTIDLSHTVNSKDNSYTCTIISGQVELFSILLALHGLYSDYYPPYFQDDKFIEVVFEKQPSEMQLFNVINAYVYELSASLNINIKVISRLPKMDFVYISSISDNPRILPNRRRLINIGNGIGEACNLYAKAIAVDEPEAKILYLAKVIEYVSQTVKRKQLVETVSMKLYSNKALNPDAEYIVELEKVFEKLKSQDTDSQVMMATILTCCDAVELAKVAPPFLREFSKISDKSKEETKEQALRKFSSSISATRNQIAHAKANYESSGFECPEDQLDQFAGCVKLAAQQAIRWYSMQPEESRLV